MMPGGRQCCAEPHGQEYRKRGVVGRSEWCDRYHNVHTDEVSQWQARGVNEQVQQQ